MDFTFLWRFVVFNISPLLQITLVFQTFEFVFLSLFGHNYLQLNVETLTLAQVCAEIPASMLRIDGSNCQSGLTRK